MQLDPDVVVCVQDDRFTSMVGKTHGKCYRIGTYTVMRIRLRTADVYKFQTRPKISYSLECFNYTFLANRTYVPFSVNVFLGGKTAPISTRLTPDRYR